MKSHYDRVLGKAKKVNLGISNIRKGLLLLVEKGVITKDYANDIITAVCFSTFLWVSERLPPDDTERVFEELCKED